MNIKFKIDKAKIKNIANAFIYDKLTKRQTEQNCYKELNINNDMILLHYVIYNINIYYLTNNCYHKFHVLLFKKNRFFKQ